MFGKDSFFSLILNEAKKDKEEDVEEEDVELEDDAEESEEDVEVEDDIEEPEEDAEVEDDIEEPEEDAEEEIPAEEPTEEPVEEEIPAEEPQTMAEATPEVTTSQETPADSGGNEMPEETQNAPIEGEASGPPEGDMGTEGDPMADDGMGEEGMEGDPMADDGMGEEGMEGDPAASGLETDPIIDNPYIRKAYYDKFKKLIKSNNELLDIIDENKKINVVNDKLEIEYTKLNNYIIEKISKSNEQINFLIQDGKILDIDIDKLKMIYTKLESKTLILLDMYENLSNKNI